MMNLLLLLVSSMSAIAAHYRGGQATWAALLICTGIALIFWRRFALVLVALTSFLVAAHQPIVRDIEFLLPGTIDSADRASPKVGFAQTCLEFDERGFAFMQTKKNAGPCSLADRQIAFALLLQGDVIKPEISANGNHCFDQSQRRQAAVGENIQSRCKP